MAEQAGRQEGKTEEVGRNTWEGRQADNHNKCVRFAGRHSGQSRQTLQRRKAFTAEQADRQAGHSKHPVQSRKAGSAEHAGNQTWQRRKGKGMRDSAEQSVRE
jgi:hypothetical protein